MYMASLARSNISSEKANAMVKYKINDKQTTTTLMPVTTLSNGMVYPATTTGLYRWETPANFVKEIALIWNVWSGTAEVVEIEIAERVEEMRRCIYGCVH